MAISGVFMTPADLDEFANKIMKRIDEQFAKLKVGSEEVMSAKEAARFMGETRQTFMKKFTIPTSQGGYPLSLMHGKGKCKKFLRSQLEAYLKGS